MKKRRSAAFGFNSDDFLADTCLAIWANFMDYFYIRLDDNPDQVLLADFHPPAYARPESPAPIAPYDLYHINLLSERRRVPPITAHRPMRFLPLHALRLFLPDLE